jgi:phospholipid/cholesterol/gamma-HCH transport system substrate-binding protein
MPRTRSLAWSELRIGIVTIVAIVITIVTIFGLTGGRGFFWEQYTLKTRFTNVAGLKSGSPVRLSGVEVGSVTDVAFAGDEVDVSFQVNEDYRERIRTGSVASIGSVSLLGESAVDITASAQGDAIEEGGYVPSRRARGQLSDVAESASQGLDEITRLVQGLREGQGTAGKLMTDDTLYDELRNFASAATGLTQSLREGNGSVAQLLNDPTMANALEGSLKNVEALTESIRAGDGSLGQLVNDDAFARNLTAATSNLQRVTERLNSGEGTAGKLITDSSLYDRLDSVTDRLDQLVDNLNEGQGTAGQLLKDQRLYENMNEAVNDVRALVADIRQDPRKFLNVSVSIF